jgi:Rod binding domain-containing protein
MAASLISGINPAAATPTLNPKAAVSLASKARGAAEDFEAVFLNSMLQQMFANVGQGPFSGGPGASVWRSFLTDEYAKSIVKAGGVGIADHVQKALLAQQEVR